MQTFRVGETVLVNFPFADAGEVKRRPALILVNTGDEDVVVARITGHMARTEHDVNITQWRESGLAVPSVVRVHKLATIQKRLVERRLGVLGSNNWLSVREKLLGLWG